MITRINVKILRNSPNNITVVCCCISKKNNIKICHDRLKRKNTNACNFRINFMINDDFYRFINFKPHNHGPFLPEIVSFILNIYKKFIPNYKNVKISMDFIVEYTNMLCNSITSLKESNDYSNYCHNLNININKYRKNIMTQIQNIDFSVETPSLVGSFFQRYKYYFLQRNLLDKNCEVEINFIGLNEINTKSTNYNSSIISKKRKKVNDTSNKNFDGIKYSNIDIINNFALFEKNNDNIDHKNQNFLELEEYDDKKFDFFDKKQNLNLSNHSPNYECNMPNFYTYLLNKTNDDSNLNQSNQSIYNIVSKKLDSYDIESNINSLDKKTEIESYKTQIDEDIIQDSNFKANNCHFTFFDIQKDLMKNLNKKLKVFMDFLKDIFQKKVKDYIDKNEELCGKNINKFLLKSIALKKKANFLTYETKYGLESILNLNQILRDANQ